MDNTSDASKLCNVLSDTKVVMKLWNYHQYNDASEISEPEDNSAPSINVNEFVGFHVK